MITGFPRPWRGCVWEPLDQSTVCWDEHHNTKYERLHWHSLDLVQKDIICIWRYLTVLLLLHFKLADVGVGVFLHTVGIPDILQSGDYYTGTQSQPVVEHKRFTAEVCVNLVSWCQLFIFLTKSWNDCAFSANTMFTAHPPHTVCNIHATHYGLCWKCACTSA